ncbi:glycosyltransferase [Leadbettera azotonutricia]|uniref:Glycosyltransferase, group 2 family n=1 Tax=Leadbettera azotonutricia (strain ATCC BAA-888 / DSM 13862 / ZAS-9) TaxID=545695 RepID=F5Y769_LEAAZ|nr:glycosyltransferase [Leadbettera azotonutricia]AEF82709.1 glycosyltransferase, group 2 family [Leadbettera azotonutricia ZAS-9]
MINEASGMVQNKENGFLSVVLYMYNNEKGIRHFFNSLYGALDANFEHFEIICVNDGSEDKAMAFVEEFAKNVHDGKIITVLTMSGHQGIEAAMNAGVDLAIGDWIFEFDIIEEGFDGKLIMEVYRKAVSGYDIVTAAPKNIHSLSSKLFYRVYNFVGNENLSSESFILISRRALNRIKTINQFVPYRKVLYSRSGLPIVKMYYDNRSWEKSERPKNGSDLALESLILFTRAIQSISLIISVFFALFTTAFGIYILIIRFFHIFSPEGWATQMLFLSIGFFGVFILFFFVIKYLSVILNVVFVKQRYLVESVRKL